MLGRCGSPWLRFPTSRRPAGRKHGAWPHRHARPHRRRHRRPMERATPGRTVTAFPAGLFNAALLAAVATRTGRQGAARRGSTPGLREGERDRGGCLQCEYVVLRCCSMLAAMVTSRLRGHAFLPFSILLSPDSRAILATHRSNGDTGRFPQRATVTRHDARRPVRPGRERTLWRKGSPQARTGWEALEMPKPCSSAWTTRRRSRSVHV